MRSYKKVDYHTFKKEFDENAYNFNPYRANGFISTVQIKNGLFETLATNDLGEELWYSTTNTIADAQTAHDTAVAHIEKEYEVSHKLKEFLIDYPDNASWLKENNHHIDIISEIAEVDNIFNHIKTDEYIDLSPITCENSIRGNIDILLSDCDYNSIIDRSAFRDKCEELGLDYNNSVSEDFTFDVYIDISVDLNNSTDYSKLDISEYKREDVWVDVTLVADNNDEHHLYFDIPINNTERDSILRQIDAIEPLAKNIETCLAYGRESIKTENIKEEGNNQMQLNEWENAFKDFLKQMHMELEQLEETNINIELLDLDEEDKAVNNYVIYDIENAEYVSDYDATASVFKDASSVIERLDVRIDAVYYDDIVSELSSYGFPEPETEHYDEIVDIGNKMKNGNEHEREFYNNHKHEFDTVDLIVNHIAEVDINKVFVQQRSEKSIEKSALNKDEKTTNKTNPKTEHDT